MTPGSYTVEFSIVAGWNTKTNQTVTVQIGQTTQIDGELHPEHRPVPGFGCRGRTERNGDRRGNLHTQLPGDPDGGAPTWLLFNHWTEDGQVVAGAGATYSFYATADRTLVAHFRKIKPSPGVLLLLLSN